MKMWIDSHEITMDNFEKNQICKHAMIYLLHE